MTFPKPSEAAFEAMAKSEPERLVQWVTSGELGPASLTFAAEMLGIYGEAELVVPVLLGLLKHPSPLTREGAVLGLRWHLAEEVREALKHQTSWDTSPGVLTTVHDVLYEDSVSTEMAKNADRFYELQIGVEAAQAAGDTELADKLVLEQRLVRTAQETLMEEAGVPSSKDTEPVH